MLALYMSFIDDESQRRLFEEIYLNYRKQMLLVARSVLGSDTDAEDVVHDVFLKIAKKHMSRISKIKNSIDLRNYLLKATIIGANLIFSRISNVMVTQSSISRIL